MHSIELHPVSIAHAAVLAALHRMEFIPPWDETAMEEILAMPGSAGLLACVDANPVGFILWRVAADEAEILTILVVPDWRGRGVGDRLVAASFAAVSQQGAAQMFLEVADDNYSAQTLYARHGFVRVGLRKGYYQGQDAYVLVAKTSLTCS